MWIYSTYITIKGKRIYASQYGLKVFRFWVDKDKLRQLFAIIELTDNCDVPVFDRVVSRVGGGFLFLAYKNIIVAVIFKFCVVTLIFHPPHRP